MKKRKDGYYTVTKTINGKRVFFYGVTRMEALKKAEAQMRIEEEGYTFEEVAEDWEEHHFSTLVWNTQKQYRPALRRAVAEFGEDLIKDITPSDISAFIHGFAIGDRSDKVVRTQLMVINQVFKYAINCLGVNISNPARDITVPKHLKKHKVTPPSSEDIKRIKENIAVPFGLFPYMLLYTGLRKNELLALTWEDVDIKSRTITVNKSIYHRYNVPYLKEPKTIKSVRTVPILDTLLPYLKKGKGLIFCNDHGTYITAKEYQTLWRNYCKATGVTCTAHQLRHCYATMLFENKVNEKTAQALLGHAQLSTTMDVYTAIRQSYMNKTNKELYGMDIN